MPDDTTMRWTVSVSRDTDTVQRSFLARHGMEEADLPKFVEDAVKWRVLDQTISEARAGFADMPADEVESLVTEALNAARHERQVPSSEFE